MVYVGHMWDDIKILGHLVCPFVCMYVCMYVCVYVVGSWDDIKNLAVSHIKNTACM